jgi:cytochrome c oxidase subunit 2
MRRPVLIALLAFAVAALVAMLVVIVAGCGSSSSSTAEGLPAGERIFRYGLDRSGQPIPGTGGMMGGRSGCADCHGRDGGGRTNDMFTAPDITYANLTDPKGMIEPDGARGHTYTDAEIRTAVTTGINPAGEQLSWPMPQWNLTDVEWTDLLSYLKTLP